MILKWSLKKSFDKYCHITISYITVNGLLFSFSKNRFFYGRTLRLLISDGQENWFVQIQIAWFVAEVGESDSSEPGSKNSDLENVIYVNIKLSLKCSILTKRIIIYSVTFISAVFPLYCYYYYYYYYYYWFIYFLQLKIAIIINKLININYNRQQWEILSLKLRENSWRFSQLHS